MDFEIPRALYETILEQQIRSHIETLRADDLIPRLNAEALDLLSRIKAILDDDKIEDPECFHRIGAMVSAFEDKGIYTPRHDW